MHGGCEGSESWSDGALWGPVEPCGALWGSVGPLWGEVQWPMNPHRDLQGEDLYFNVCHVNGVFFGNGSFCCVEWGRGGMLVGENF